MSISTQPCLGFWKVAHYGDVTESVRFIVIQQNAQFIYTLRLCYLANPEKATLVERDRAKIKQGEPASICIDDRFPSHKCCKSLESGKGLAKADVINRSLIAHNVNTVGRAPEFEARVGRAQHSERFRAFFGWYAKCDSC